MVQQVQHPDTQIIQQPPRQRRCLGDPPQRVVQNGAHQQGSGRLRSPGAVRAEGGEGHVRLGGGMGGAAVRSHTAGFRIMITAVMETDKSTLR